ncbi:MAG: RNA-binding protein [Myxococcota bacterium]|jgi:RNA-binding protein
MPNSITLTGRQKRHLRSLAHHLKPVVIIGADRVTPGVVGKVEQELVAHELIKIRITDGDKNDVAEAVTVLCEQTRAALVQTIGHTLVLYRPDPQEPGIRFPKR